MKISDVGVIALDKMTAEEAKQILREIHSLVWPVGEEQLPLSDREIRDVFVGVVGIFRKNSLQPWLEPAESNTVDSEQNGDGG